MQDLDINLKNSRFRGWQFWTVSAIGGHNPHEIANKWSIIDVFDAYYDIRIKQIFE